MAGKIRIQAGCLFRQHSHFAKALSNEENQTQSALKPCVVILGIPQKQRIDINVILSTGAYTFLSATGSSKKKGNVVDNC